MTGYEDFLRDKVVQAPLSGLDVPRADLHPKLFEFQKDAVLWALRGGRRALFESFGLGKTMQQLEITRQITNRYDGQALIVLPLGVKQEFTADAQKMDMEITYVRTDVEASAAGPVVMTNYERVRDGSISPGYLRSLTAVCLDEASVLRGFGGTKTFREFMRLLAGDGGRGPSGTGKTGDGIPYRFVATATPSPNDFIELLAYAAFLGVMDVSEAKTRFFKRDSTKADKLTLHAHKEREFWLWVSTWALFITTPSDLGYSDEGYELPSLDIEWHEIATDHQDAGADASGQGRLLRNAALGIVEAAREKRDSISVRVAKLTEIITDGRETPGLPERVLPEEPRAALGSTAGARKEELPRESRELPEAESESSPEEIRADTGRLPRHPRRTGRRLCDLLGASSRTEDGGGPLPPDRQGAGDPLCELQYGTGSTERGSGPDLGGGELSDRSQVVLWCDLNAEQKAIENALSNAGMTFSSLFGRQDIETRERLLVDWKARRTEVFLSKPMMYGAGVNLQQSHTMIFAGIGFKVQDILQAVHRIHRFLQTHPCTVHFIYTEAERDVRRTLEHKWAQHTELVANMTAIVREYGLARSATAEVLARSLVAERREESGAGWSLIQNDCVDETARMESDSVGLVLSSIPFSSQYEYTPSYRDFGHTDSSEHFFEQMDFLTPELLRVLRPGRLMAIHVKDRITPGGLTGLGFQTVQPFHADCIYHYQRHGFAYLGMKTIVTDVVRENNQTYRLGWTEQCKDGSRMGCGMPEYLLLFRKPPSDQSDGYADVPVVKDKAEYSRARWQIDAHGFTRSSGKRLLAPEDLVGIAHEKVYKLFRRFSAGTVYDFEHHVTLGESLEARRSLPVTFMLMPPTSWHPDVWTDVTRMRTLNGAQAAKGKEMHLCPLQFDIVDRAIAQYTEPGDVVYDPFAGLGTVPLRALKLGRHGHGVELNPAYWADGVFYMRAAEETASTPTLFDLLELAEVATT